MKRWLLASALAAVVGSGVAQAVAVQPLEAVQAAAAQAVQDAAPPGARVVARADPLDPRLRLAACNGPLQAAAPDLSRGVARLSIPVTCATGAAWTIRVLVRVQMLREVLVTSRALARGDVVGAGDVRTEARDVTRLAYGYISGLGAAAGRQVRRSLGAGTVLTPGMLAAREVVKRGQQVSVVARLDDVQVRASGIALQAGDRGDVVRVKSLSCGCVVQGTVSAPGVVDAMP